VHKRYRCLVCLGSSMGSSSNSSSNSSSMGLSSSLGNSPTFHHDLILKEQMERLESYVNDRTIVRHYLAPSVRAPKIFVYEPPKSEIKQEDEDKSTSSSSSSSSSWPECLLRITKVGKPIKLVNHSKGEWMARSLWHTTGTMPDSCIGVTELEIELLTGRTHQIRGQLSLEGFPLVGDAMYGGAIPSESDESMVEGEHNLALEGTNGYLPSERLALQCCELRFLDPDVKLNTGKKKRKEKDATFLVPSKRWNTFHLNNAWWTPIVNQWPIESD